MKKAFKVLSLILVFAFVLVSCEEGLPDGITKVMGTMGNNVLGVDKSKVNEAVDNAKPVAFEFGGAIMVGGQNVEFDKANGKIKVGEFELEVEFPEAMMLPSDNLSSIVSVLESNAKGAMQKELSVTITNEQELAAVKGTAALISSALDVALGAGGGSDDSPAVQALQSIKDSLIPSDPDYKYTKADALVLQALTNVVFSAAETVSVIADPEAEPNPSDMINDIYPDLMALNSICQNSGSSLNLDLAGIVDQLTK